MKCFLSPRLLAHVFIGLSLLLPALINAQSGNIGVDRNLSGKVPASSYPQRKGALSEREMAMATTAWIYFENNYNLETGLVNAVDNYPSTTMWDTASYLGALVAARELKIIDKAKFDSRMVLLLKTMNTMVLFRSEMPNKVYHTKTAAKVDYGNNPGEIGFSALDLGRLLIWFKIIKERYPAHANAIDNVVLRWDFSNAVDKMEHCLAPWLIKIKRPHMFRRGASAMRSTLQKGFNYGGFILIWQLCLSHTIQL
jgi:Protein of unknown function (DUF3131)